MLKLPNNALKGKDTRYTLIGIFAAVALVSFYFLGFLFIQTIALIAYMAIFPAILVWEKKKRERAVTDPSRLSEDDLWSKTKMKIENIEQRAGKERNPATKGALLQEKRDLESKLRQLEWKIRESEMTQMYNASKGNIRQIESSKSVFVKMTEMDAKFKGQRAITKELLKILKDIEDVMKNEEPASREISLVRIANDLKAQHSALKRALKSSPSNGIPASDMIVADYWACWALVTSIAAGLPVDKNIVKYASPDIQPELSRFLRTSI